MSVIERLKEWAGIAVEVLLGPVDPFAGAADRDEPLTEAQRKAAKAYMEEIAEEAVRRHMKLAAGPRPEDSKWPPRTMNDNSDNGELPKAPVLGREGAEALLRDIAGPAFKPRLDANSRSTKAAMPGAQPKKLEALEKIRAEERLIATTVGAGHREIDLRRDQPGCMPVPVGVLRVFSHKGAEDNKELISEIVDLINRKR